VLEFCPGRDLAYHLDCEEANRFSQARTQFYSAQLTLALEYLHRAGVVYRDLKPDNVLLDASGNIRIADFGLCKEGIRADARSHSFCGSPAYLSPEMLAGTGHGQGTDWYGLGILIFEMLSGLPPFYCRDRAKMWHDIQYRPLKAVLPAFISSPASALLHELLEKDESKRLGCGIGKVGSSAVKSQPFFASIDWDRVIRCDYPPPFIPSQDSDE